MSTQFAYTAVPLDRSTGALVRGVRAADDERVLRDTLRAQGLIPVSVRPVRFLDAVRSGGGQRRVRGSDRLWFFETLAFMVGSQVPIETAMQEMADVAPRERLRRVCLDVRERLRSGSSLSASIAEIGSASGPGRGLAGEHHIAILRSGERSGRLDHASTLVARSLIDAQRIRSIVVGRLIYPVILIAATVIVLWVLATFVVPTFADTLTTLGGELPWQTTLTLWISGVLLWLVPVLFLAGLLFAAARDTLIPERRKVVWSARLLRVPVAGELLWHNQAGVVCDVLASMLEGGGDVLEALTQSLDVVRSRELRRRLQGARSRGREGSDLGKALRGEGGEGVLPPMTAAVVGVGVRSGELVGALRRAAELCVERQSRTTQRLLTLMEPAIVLVLAASVGWVVYSLVVGMLAMTDVVSG